MKQEAISTFNEGLVFDLNPITTPANVLTDCINGTFLTFNGDELSLQNDAGNTTIAITDSGADPYDPDGRYAPGNNVYLVVDGINQYYKNLTGNNTGSPLTNTTDWKELVVQLSEGFYPLGIKEYGGILYIVSAKRPIIEAALFSHANTYQKGDIIYVTRAGVNYYFESLTNDNIENVPYESNRFWLSIGIERDYINKYGFVEFGSYPSPGILEPGQFDASVDFECINNEDPETEPNGFRLELYSPQVINNSIFQAGVYVTFFQIVGRNLVTTNISFSAFNIDQASGLAVYNENNSERKIYKVKLYHQLTNGFIDLTEDVWQKYANFVALTRNEELNSGTGPNFWFNDDEFRYYCPHNYKGKLVISVELEELDEFSLDPVTIELNTGTNNYDITFPINYVNTTGWTNIMSPAVAPTVTLAYTIDNSSTINGTFFDGAGLNDATLSGTYRGDTNQTLLIKITTVGTPDKFDWSLDEGVSWEATAVSITAGAMILGSTGLSVTFGATTGHTINNYWQSYLTPIIGSINNTEPNFEIETEINKIVKNNLLTTIDGHAAFILSLNADLYQGKTIRYKIIPDFSVGTSQYYPFSTYLPQEFIDIHTIYGSEIIATKYDDYIIYQDPDEFVCDPVTGGIGRFYSLVLKSATLGLVDNLLDPTATKHGFTLEGNTITPPYNELGTFTISEFNKATNISFNDALFPLGENKDYIKGLVENTYVLVNDSLCTTKMYVTIVVNKAFGFGGVGELLPIIVTQGGTEVIGEILDSLTYIYFVESVTDFTIEARPLEGTVSYPYTTQITTDGTTIHFGIVTKIYSRIYQNDPGMKNDVVLHIPLSPALFGTTVERSTFTITNVNYGDTIVEVDMPDGDSATFMQFDYNVGNDDPRHILTFDTESAEIYENLTDVIPAIPFAIEGSNNIFLKSQTLPLL